MARRGLWPTPTATLGKDGEDRKLMAKDGQPVRAHERMYDEKGQHVPMTLDRAVKHWPTPTKGDQWSAGNRNLEGSKAHMGVSLTDAVLHGNSHTSRGGKLKKPRLTNLPTPTADIARNGRGDRPGELARKTPNLWARLVQDELFPVESLTSEPSTQRDLFPTPAVDDAHNVTRASGDKQSLTRTVHAYPTPTVQDSENVNGPSQRERNSLPLNQAVRTDGSPVSGRLSPTFVEWLMGFPRDWTVISGASASRLLAMRGSRKRPSPPSPSSSATPPSTPTA
jgi:hypothetical protein